MRSKVTLFLSSLVFCLSLLQSATAQTVKLSFSVPPLQTPEQLQQRFQPLMDYLSKASGTQIQMVPTRSFYEYGRRMRSGEFDMLLDGPHFVKYRMDKLQHQVLAKQAGELRFVVVVKDSSSLKTMNDLVNKRVCSPKAPHLGTLTYLSYYTSPARQPILKSEKGFKQAVDCLHNNTADAAVVRDKYWQNRIKDKKGLRVLFTTDKVMPARAFSVRSDIPDTVKEKIQHALLAPEATPYLKQAFAGTGAGKIVPAKQKEYRSQDELLNMVWGFHF